MNNDDKIQQIIKMVHDQEEMEVVIKRLEELKQHNKKKHDRSSKTN